MFWSDLWLLAQTVAPAAGADPLYTGISILGGGGAIAGSGWLVRHLIVVVLPAMHAQNVALLTAKDSAHSLALQEKDKAHALVIEKLTTKFEAAIKDSEAGLKEMWTVHRSDIGSLWGEVKSQSEKMTAAINQLTTELRTVDKTMKITQQGGQSQ